MNDVVIKLNNVSKYYKLYKSPNDRLKEALSPFRKNYHQDFYALKGINLEIKQGEIVGIVGKNGCGKSTLLKIISGVLGVSSGSSDVKGNISAMLELGSGFNPEFTGMQNIFFYGTILGFSTQEMQSKVDDILNFADLGEFIDQPLKTYSSGMKSRLGFAVAVYVEPDILILDEVLSVGDVLFRRKCYAKMEEFFQAGKTIIYVSHSVDSVIQLCDRAIFLDAGEILFDSDPKTVTFYYQKFLFSKDENKQEIKQEILNLAPGRNEPSFLETEKKAMTENCSDDGSDEESRDNTQAFFIDNFVSKSMVKIKNYEVELYDFEILTQEGRVVNALVMDETYCYCYKAKFDQDVSDVSFGAKLKTEKGLLISLISHQQGKEFIDSIKPGLHEVKITFKCKLLPGVYYFDSSSTGIVGTDRSVLCRMKDAIIFKVLPLPASSLYSGLVNLNQTIEVQACEKNSDDD